MATDTKDRKSDQVFATLTQKVIDLMESGAAGDWMKPWVGSGIARPRNAVSKHYFTGGNWMLLSLLASERGYDHGLWATYKQWESVGAQVRKGEKGVQLIRVSISFRCQDGCRWRSSRPNEACSAHGRGARRKSIFPVAFTAFHGSQVDGWEAPAPAETFEHERLDAAEAFFAAVGSEVKDGSEAYYSPSADAITMPPLDRFREVDGYYATLAHEHVHWTGAKHRLDRGLSNITRFGDPVYAREELVAELGSVFLCNILDIEVEPRGDHAAYLQSWLKSLKGDSSFIWKAASDAEKAVRFLTDAAAPAKAEEEVQHAVA
jgi:antirestriction protein ArdC